MVRVRVRFRVRFGSALFFLISKLPTRNRYIAIGKGRFAEKRVTEFASYYTAIKVTRRGQRVRPCRIARMRNSLRASIRRQHTCETSKE